MKREKLRIIVSAFVLSGLTSVNYHSNAAVATAKVTVNVVPASEIHASQQFGFTIPAERDSQAQQIQADSNHVGINSLKNKSSVTVQIEDNQNNTYGLTISSGSTLTGSSTVDTITINNMNVDVFGSTDDVNEQELLIDGDLTMPNDTNSDHYTGTAEITVNYN